MISSLKSRFEQPRRAVVLTGESLTVYHWENGSLSDSFLFEADDSGQYNFARYLHETPGIPVYLMVDIVEEEFRQETVPHVFGADRRAVVERKQKRLFRGTDYLHSEVQGRETEGRKDDRLLMSAIINPDLVKPWVDLLTEYKIPLVGIYSLPLVSKELLPVLSATSSNVLLVTLQSSSGLRQSYFRELELKISRLAKMPRLGTVPYGPTILDELEKVRRYLNSLRLLSREEPLDIYILSHGELLTDLSEKCLDAELVRYHLIDIADLADTMGIHGVVTTPFSELIFAQLLLSTTPSNHYALPAETTYYKLHRSRLGMVAAGLLLLLGSAIWSGFNFIEGISLKEQSIDAAQKANFYQARFEMAKEGLPPTPVEPMDIQTAVEVVDTMSKYKASPLDVMQTLSTVLRDYPDFHIRNIEWLASTDPEKPISEADQDQLQGDGDGSGPGGDVAYLYYQITQFEGYIEPFDGNYREALAEVSRFAEALRVADSVYKVRILSLPLDVSSEASLQGKADTDQVPAEATFSLRVVMGVGNSEMG